MSTALLSAPATHKVKEPVIKPKKVFAESHRAGVQLDCDNVRQKGMSRIIVTPQRFVVRDQYMSRNVRVDLPSADCKQITWLKKLYRRACPTGMYLRFDIEVMYGAACGDHLEDIYMLVVIFDLRQS